MHQLHGPRTQQNLVGMHTSWAEDTVCGKLIVKIQHVEPYNGLLYLYCKLEYYLSC